MTRSDLWTLFPAAALLGFAGWVVLMVVDTGDVAAVMAFVTIFLAGAWKACRWYHQVARPLEGIEQTRTGDQS